MGVVGRMGDWVSAKSSEWMGNKEKNDAGAIANKAAEDFQKDTAEFTNGAAEATAQLEGVKDQRNAAAAEAKSWHNKAVLLLKNGDEGSAKQALARETTANGLVTKLDAQIATQQARIDAYKEKAQNLQGQAADARNQAAAIGAQQQVVSAEEKIKAVDPSSDLAKLQKAQADVTARERKQDAINDMDGSSLDAKASKLEKDQQTNDALAALKAEVAGQKPSAPPAPAPAADGFNIAK